MSPEDQPTILTPPPNSSRPASVGWQAPSVEELQAKLPQYEVLEILGRGGMGAVYKARQKSLKRLVAIKILPLGLADDEFKFAERFQNEAQTMAAMNHPAIVSVYDFGETSDGLLYFVMENVDGTDVQKMIAVSGRLSGEHALAIAAHVCDALAYAHARGVIHRDIKPANILIDQEGRIKVADFGLAKMNDPAQTSGLTRTGTAMGTPDYVAPEMLTSGMAADHRADIYAVGVMLYQMLTGEVPRGMFKLPSDKGVGSDPRFDAIICKAMEQDREERYQTSLEMRRDLDAILTAPQPNNHGKRVVPASELQRKHADTQPPTRGAASQAPSQKAAIAAEPEARPKKQSPAAIGMSITGIIAVLGIAAFIIFGGNPKPATKSADASVVVAELTASSSSAQAPPSSSARTFNGHRYEFVSGSFTWPEARAQAEQRGGYLAIITSAEEHNWAWKTFSDQLPPKPKDKVWTRGWWLGASQTAFEKPWQWVTREPLEFTLWGRKEPSAAINPPRYLWIADANNDEGSSSWSAQNGALRGGFLIEWDNAGVP